MTISSRTRRSLNATIRGAAKAIGAMMTEDKMLEMVKEKHGLNVKPVPGVPVTYSQDFIDEILLTAYRAGQLSQCHEE
jgi:hypothetical protein